MKIPICLIFVVSLSFGAVAIDDTSCGSCPIKHAGYFLTSTIFVKSDYVNAQLYVDSCYFGTGHGCVQDLPYGYYRLSIGIDSVILSSSAIHVRKPIDTILCNPVPPPDISKKLILIGSGIIAGCVILMGIDSPYMVHEKAFDQQLGAYLLTPFLGGLTTLTWGIAQRNRATNWRIHKKPYFDRLKATNRD
jgi:hypothetical protein